MTNIAEIKGAIERLSSVELTELVSWLDEYLQTTNASAQLFAMYDREED